MSESIIDELSESGIPWASPMSWQAAKKRNPNNPVDPVQF
jgi:hypothetical protein